jgi:hypothetical protein
MAHDPGDDPREVEEMREEPPGQEAPEDEDEGASSPFDHPAFLPVILFAVALWFGFDGWIAEDTESVRFNRYGFGFLLGAALYFTLDSYARRPYLLALLFVAYAVWLGAFALLGSPGAWYNDVASARLFNRYAGLGFLALAVLAALREAWRMRRSGAETPGA